MYQPILYAEDDENDVFFMQRALKEVGVGNRLLVVRNGQEALDYLTGAGEFSDREQHPLPALVILDLRMPLISGLDVLRRLRAHAELDALPVVVLVGSHDDHNIDAAMELGANACIVKPPTGEALRKVIRDLGEEGFDLRGATRQTEAASKRQLRE